MEEAGADVRRRYVWELGGGEVAQCQGAAPQPGCVCASGRLEPVHQAGRGKDALFLVLYNVWLCGSCGLAGCVCGGAAGGSVYVGGGGGGGGASCAGKKATKIARGHSPRPQHPHVCGTQYLNWSPLQSGGSWGVGSRVVWQAGWGTPNELAAPTV